MTLIQVEPPVLVFGGPYSNLQATRRLRIVAARLGIPAERVICTGDVVAYCAHPEETVAEIRDWGVQVIQGNCEEQLAAAADDCGCGFEEGTACDRLSKGWYEFANSQLSRASRDWMASLPHTLDLAIGTLRARVVHGGVEQINRFMFASETESLGEELERAQADLVIAGHCGFPFVRQIAGRCWFNPGVIGMPANDGTPRTWYGLIEPAPVPSGRDAVTLSVRALDYDHGAAAQAVAALNVAAPYGQALISGLWPSLDVLPETERRQTGRPLRAHTRLFEKSRADTRDGVATSRDGTAAAAG